MTNQVYFITTNILLMNSKILKILSVVSKTSKNLLHEQWKTKKEIVYKNARKLHSKLLSIYSNDYNNTTIEEKEKMGAKFTPNNLVIERF